MDGTSRYDMLNRICRAGTDAGEETESYLTLEYLAKEVTNNIFSWNGADFRWWTFNTYKEWQEQFPFWCEKTIKTCILNLEQKGYIISGNFNKMKYDRTKWYAIDYDKVPSYFGKNYTMDGNYLPEGGGNDYKISNYFSARDFDEKVAEFLRAVLLGDDEIAAGKCSVKDMQSGEQITVTAEEAFLAEMEPQALADLFIVSQFAFGTADEGLAGENFPNLKVVVAPAAGDKCPRCWKHTTSPNANGLCPRCAAVLGE